MAYKNQSHHRRSIRLKGYDYTSQGAYFVTLVTWHREEIFGSISNGEMVLSQIGQIVEKEWEKTEKIRKEINLDLYIVMPNHLHGIVWINENIEQNLTSPNITRGVEANDHDQAPLQSEIYRPSRSLGSLIAGFKSAATKRVNKLRNLPGHPLWQRNYYDRIIRNEDELEQIRRYIEANPILWDEDQENPKIF